MKITNFNIILFLSLVSIKNAYDLNEFKWCIKKNINKKEIIESALEEWSKNSCLKFIHNCQYFDIYINQFNTSHDEVEYLKKKKTHYLHLNYQNLKNEEEMKMIMMKLGEIFGLKDSLNKNTIMNKNYTLNKLSSKDINDINILHNCYIDDFNIYYISIYVILILLVTYSILLIINIIHTTIQWNKISKLL